ncbi:protein zwilch homolog [Rhinophrynus dorsalis]
MWRDRHRAAGELQKFLSSVYEQVKNKKSLGPFPYEPHALPPDLEETLLKPWLSFVPFREAVLQTAVHASSASMVSTPKANPAKDKGSSENKDDKAPQKCKACLGKRLLQCKHLMLRSTEGWRIQKRVHIVDTEESSIQENLSEYSSEEEVEIVEEEEGNTLGETTYETTSEAVHNPLEQKHQQHISEDIYFLFGKKETESLDKQDDTQVHVVTDGQYKSLEGFWSGNGMIFIMEKKPSNLEDDVTEESQNSGSHSFDFSMQEHSQILAIPTMRARQLLSSYTLVHNPNMAQLRDGKSVEVLPQFWVRCDSSDAEGTCWLGAEPMKTSRNEVTGMSFRMVTCSGPTTDKSSFPNLETLRKIHRARHHSSAMQTRGFAQYDLFGSNTVENSVIESQSSVTVDFVWNGVDSILQLPPLTSAATLNIRVESGDLRSPVYAVYKELDFLLVLAEGLKTGVTEWPEAIESKPAMELVQEILNELKNKLDGINISVSKKDNEKVKSDTAAVDSSIQSFIAERGDLDFAETLWCKMRKSVSSYQDVVNCFSLVIQSLKHGEVHPWIQRGSSSTLSKLIQQSYHGTMQSISLSGLTPIRMLLEIGLDKMKKDYINCFIGQDLATFNYLDYFISTSVDLQEQVHRVKKLHHMLEVVVICNAFLSLGHENLFPLTQSCLKYYKENPWNEEHVFQLPIRPSIISTFYQNSHPQSWRVEILSGHGQKEVKTTWQLSTRPPVDHVSFAVPDMPIDTTISGENEEVLYYPTQVSCSQVYFC